MSELKAVHAFDVYDAYTKTGDDDAAQVYIKSEADKVIAHHKYKRCLAMADMCSEALCYWDNVKYTFFKGEAYCFRKMNHYGKWGQIWLAIAEKFKEAK